MQNNTIQAVDAGADKLIGNERPSVADALRGALFDTPRGMSDAEAAGKARTIARTWMDLQERAARGIDPKATDEAMRAEAAYYSQFLTGSNDVYGRLWTPDRKGYGPGRGREFLERMRSFVLDGPERRFTQRWRDYYAKDEAGRTAEAMEHRKTIDAAKRAAGEAVVRTMDFFNRSGNDAGLTREEEAEAPEDVRAASALLMARGHIAEERPDEEYAAATGKVRGWRERRYQESVRREYEQELSRENAWNEVSLTLGALAKKGETDERARLAYDCVRAVMESADNRLPESHYAKFNALDDDMKRAVIRTRTILKPEVEGGFVNTIEDAAIGAANVAMNVATAPVRFGNKMGMMAMNSAFDAGFDVNEIARRRQYLYQATGDFYASGDSAAIPQMQFEAVCENHGFFGDAVIGAVSTLPYMAAAAVPYAGTALVALEAMNEMDDHVSLNGGDVTDPEYIARSAVFGALYAYTERLQVEGLLGAASDKELRLALLKGFWNGLKDGKVVRQASVGTISESVQEGLQNGIMAVNNALALDQDATLAFAEGFTEDFVNSLGTMLVVEGGGIVAGHVRRSGLHNPFTAAGREAGRAERSADLERTVNEFSALQEMVRPEARGEKLVVGTEINRFLKIWKDGGVGALAKKGGLSDDAAMRVDSYFTELRASAETTDAADDAAPDGMSDEDAAKHRETTSGFLSGTMDEATARKRLSEVGFTDAGSDAWMRWAVHERSVLGMKASIVEMMKESYESRKNGVAEMDEDRERVSRAMEELDFLRRIWADASKGVLAKSKSGKVVSDPGARALEARGFTKEGAERLSLLFHRERAAAYSQVALDGVRALYDARTRGKVDARAAMAARFGGRFRTIQTGVDGQGRPVYGDFISFTGRDGATNLVRFERSPTGAPDFSVYLPTVAKSIEDATAATAHPITMAEWERATPEERERMWKERGLYSEGDFAAGASTVSLTVPADPSARVTSDQAARIIGTVTVASESSGAARDEHGLKTGYQNVIDNSVAFHETFHAFAHFAASTGLWDEKDIEQLRGRFGDPAKGVSEQFDEEAGAEAFRAFNARRMEGALTEEDQSGPFMKLLSLAKSLDDSSKESASKERRAANAEEALFDQIMLDRYAAVPDFTAERKAEEEKAKKAEEAKRPAADNAKPQTENAKPDSENVEPQPEPAKKLRPATEKTWTASTPMGGVKVGGHYAVYDLAELVHSNNPLYKKHADKQERNRKDNKIEEQKRGRIVSEFDGARLMDSSDTANGAPIVFIDEGDDGRPHPFVLSGSGRVLVLNELVARHLFDRYRNALKAWADENGVEVPEGDEKVLVRVVTDLGGSSLKEVARLSNKEATTRYSETEQARVDAENIEAAGIAGLYRANQNGTPDMTHGANDEFFRRFAQIEGGETIFDENNQVTEDGRSRIVRAFIYLACGHGSRGADVVRKLITMSDTLGIGRQRNALQFMAPSVSALERNADYAIGADVSRAAADFMAYVEAKAAGKVGSLAEFMAQGDMFDPRSDVADEILRLLASDMSARAVADRVKAYCETARRSDADGSLGGSANARTRMDVWREAARAVDERVAKEKDARRLSVSGIYTGSAADYEKPSLQYIGTGEGSQVYGWGLYGSNVRGVAEGYAETIRRDKASTPDELWPKYKGNFESELEYDPVRSFALKYVGREGSIDKALQYLRRADNFVESAASKAKQAAEWLENNRDDVTPPQTPSAHLYEQTFFTNRAPGDESHLLSWYEPVSEENMSRIANAIKDAGGLFDTYKLPSGATTYIFSDKEAFGNKGTFVKNAGEMPNGVDVYKALSAAYGSPKAASEFLARADIDGVKYPVDSYGGKTVKDGETAGWNYVSFRDDNINVDHKWVDGQRRFSFYDIGGRDIAVAETEPLSTKDAKDEKKVREILAGVIGQEFVQRGESVPVKVDAKFADEFWGSNTSQKLRDKLDKLWRAKVSALPILGDIVGSTPIGPVEAARHINARFKNRAKFYRCPAEFGIKRHDGVAVYKCDLLILEMDGGARYVYDLVKMTKPTLTAKSSLDGDLVQSLYGRTNLTGESATKVPEGTAQSVPQPDGNGNRKFSISGVYTGSAADYEKPSLQYIGTGEGSQVYGWGLYGSSKRGVAEFYSSTAVRRGVVVLDGKEMRPNEWAAYPKGSPEWLVLGAVEFDGKNFSKEKTEGILLNGDERWGEFTQEQRNAAVEYLRAHEFGYAKQSEKIYEQTFFTNRAPGDESHLLSWFEPVSEENLKRILEGLKKEGVSDRFKDMYWLQYKGMSSYLESNDIKGALLDNGSTGDAVYQQLTSIIGSPKEASEFLARADIDGVKYPVDSYGKLVKDGDEAGWNYVSFRDDNINVDHKWVDGQRRFSIAVPLVDAMFDRERRALEPREPRGASPYFSDAAGAMDFPVRALRTLKDEPESSVENAAARMGRAARGEIRKRAPISVADNGDGTYTVVDGNATVWAAARGGLETVRAVVVGNNTGTRLGNSVYMVQEDTSGCDLPVNGKMKLRTHGLDGLEGEAARERAYAQAEENVPLLKAIVNAVAAHDGTEALFRSPNKPGPGTDPREVGKEVKKRRRVDEKARNDYKNEGGYSRVVDLIGGTLVLKDTDAFDEAIGHLRQEAARQGASIAQVKKLNMKPGAKGYQDVKVSIRFPNGGIGEVIVVGDYMNDAKFNRGGHVVYDASRVLENKKSDPEIEATFEKLDELSVAIYARGEKAPDAESFASMKASASASLTRLLPILGRNDLISSKDINTLKEALSESHLAKPPSVDSYAMPARSFIQNAISNSFSDEEKTKGILSESSLTVNGKSDIAKKFSTEFPRPDAMSDDEAAARRSIRAMLADGGEKEAKSALENYVAYFELSHGGVPQRRTLARMGLAMGMKTVSPDELLRKGASIAERMRGTLIERAARNGDVSTALALLKREKDMDAALDDLVAGAAGAGGTLTHKGVGRVNDIINLRVKQLMRDFSAASLADMEGDTGLDIAAEILANDPNAFDGELKKAKGIDPDAAAETAEDQARDGEGGDEEDGEGEGEGLTDLQKWERKQLRRAAEAKVAKFIADAKALAEERKAAADRLRQKRAAESGDSDGDGGASGGPGDDTPSRKPQNDAVLPGGSVRADFRTPREFAAFLRVWAADKFARTHGLTSLGKAEENRLFAEFYRICARRELNDLAQKLLAPKGARAWVNRRLQDLEKGVRPGTVERISADVFAFINKAAIRESRAELVKKFKNDLKERYFKGTRFDQFKQDADRRVTGWVEEAARYICRVCDLSKREINGEPSQIQRERAELRAIIDRRAEVYDESGKDVAQASVDDGETRRALWKLALLDKFGAMTSLMPGEMLDLQDAAFRHLETQAADLEAKWKETREFQERIRGDLTAAVVAPNGQRYQEKGWLNGRLFDALNGLIRLRLRHLTRFASEDARKKAEDSINEVLVMLGDGETLYARALQDDRAAFFAGLAEIFQKPGGGADNGRIRKYLARMEEPIPEELSKRLSTQGFAGTMTYGQMLQLLVSLEQRSFRDAVKENGREGQADLIRNYVGVDEDGNPVRVFTAEDERFIAWLRAFYEAKRETISKVTERMVGQKVDSPDPLYCPVRRLMDDRARGLHSDPTPRWDPISKVFSRRVENLRDFDETRSIVSMFFEASEESAKLVAWAERGSIIRNVFTSVGVQSAIRRAFGPGELGRILKQLEATFNGGESRQRTPGELAVMDKVMNFTTYAYLGFNPLSAMKQTTSFTVWANALPGGFRDLWRHMTHFEASVVRHLKESDEYKVRYGNDVGAGQDAATKGVYENPSLNPVARIFSGAGMWLLKKGDFVPGIWIAQGVYKDMLNRNLQRGMSDEEADRRAITETFNMLEETQQSGRTYNTNALSIEHGRIGRLLTQFATSPLQQLQYETQAWREWRDMVRYGMGKERIAEARRRFLRAVVINHVLIPAALELVISAYRLVMGEEPPWEKEGAHWDFLVEILLGQFGRVFLLGAFAKTTLNAVFKRQGPRGGELLPSEGILGMAAKAGFMVHDFATCDVDHLQKDIEGIARGAAATRTAYNIFRRATGDSDKDRKRKKEMALKK